MNIEFNSDNNDITNNNIVSVIYLLNTNDSDDIIIENNITIYLNLKCLFILRLLLNLFIIISVSEFDSDILFYIIAL